MRQLSWRALRQLGAWSLVAAGSGCSHRSSVPISRRPTSAATVISDAHLAGLVDSIVDLGRREFRIPGISLVIMRGHNVVLSKGYGMADLARQVPATDSTVYQVGSLSKQITAAAIMTLVEAGRVRLDDPVSKYLPELPVARDSALRIHTLLAQTSGLQTWDDLPELQRDGSSSDTAEFKLARIVALIGREHPLFPPGSWWSYSNSNYTLLAAVIERATGVTYDDYLAQVLFSPLGMGHTRSCARPPLASELPRAIGYEVVGDSFAVLPTRRFMQPGMTGAGGLCSSVVELATWMRALMDGRAVSRQSLQQMTTPHSVGAGFTPPYGFGLSFLPLAEQPAIWHTGVLNGFMSVLAYLPEQDIVIAAAGNSRHTLLRAIVNRVVREMFSSTRPLRDLPLSVAEIERAVGTYNDALFTFRIVADSGMLYADTPQMGGVRERLLYQGEHEFAVAGPAEFRFRFDSTGTKAQTVVWDWAEVRAFGRRVGPAGTPPR